jgi:hypothetical protein
VQPPSSISSLSSLSSNQIDPPLSASLRHTHYIFLARRLRIDDHDDVPISSLLWTAVDRRVWIPGRSVGEWLGRWCACPFRSSPCPCQGLFHCTTLRPVDSLRTLPITARGCLFRLPPHQRSGHTVLCSRFAHPTPMSHLPGTLTTHRPIPMLRIGDA